MVNKSLRSIMLVVIVAGALAVAPVVFAQGYTPEEQAEVDAAAVDNPVPQQHPDDRTISCAVGTPTTLYFSDFESDNGGWTVTSADNYWEWGAVTSGFDQCDSTSYAGPSSAYSGSNAWATNLDGCYPNFGGSTVLAHTFDLSGLAAGTPIQLEWHHWYHVFETFDYAIARVNGSQVWRTPDSNPSSDWELVTVDLSSYAGSSVTVEFELYATTVVNRPGWYIDDVEISYCDSNSAPVPGIPTLSTTGIALFFALMAAAAFAIFSRRT